MGAGGSGGPQRGPEEGEAVPRPAPRSGHASLSAGPGTHLGADWHYAVE